MSKILRVDMVALAVILLCLPLGGKPQTPLSKIQDDGKFQANFAVSQGNWDVVATCKMAGMDPEDLYDCKLENGHTLDALARAMARANRNEYEREHAHTLAAISGWQRAAQELRDFARSIQQTIGRDNDSKS